MSLAEACGIQIGDRIVEGKTLFRGFNSPYHTIGMMRAI